MGKFYHLRTSKVTQFAPIEQLHSDRYTNYFVVTGNFFQSSKLGINWWVRFWSIFFLSTVIYALYILKLAIMFHWFAVVNLLFYCMHKQHFIIHNNLRIFYISSFKFILNKNSQFILNFALLAYYFLIINYI